MAFFFLWKLPLTVSHGHSPGGMEISRIHASTSAGAGNFYRTPTGHPKNNGPVFSRVTEPEAEDDVQVAGFYFVYQAGCFISALHHLLREQSLSVLPPPFLQNRPTVPLFVLFHSWKNFVH